MHRKFALSVVITGVLVTTLAYNNCARSVGKGNGDVNVNAVACEDYVPHASKLTTYGPFIPGVLDTCHSYTGRTSRWDGMPAVGMASVPPGMWSGGTACGTCFEVKGPASTAMVRVTTLCPSCAVDTIGLDTPTFDVITTGNGSGLYHVEMTAVACPVSGGVKYSMNAGTNPYYLNLSAANHSHPIDTLQVNYGSGFVALARGGGGNDFSLSLASPVRTSVQIKATDIYGQVIKSTIDPAPTAESSTTEQFGNCQ